MAKRASSLAALYKRREALCQSILSVDDLRKRDLLREVQAEISRREAKLIPLDRGEEGTHV